MNANSNLPAGIGSYPQHVYVQQPTNPYSINSAQDPFDKEEGFDPLQLLWYVIHYRWIIAAFLFFGLLGGIVFTWMQTPLYRGTAKLEILTSSAKVLQDLEIFSEGNDIRAFETAREKLVSRDLARRVAFELNLTEKPDFLQATPTFSLRNLFSKALGLDSSDSLSELSQEVREKRAIVTLQQGLSASIIRNTSIVALDFVHADAKYAAEIPNQFARSFMEEALDKRNQSSELARRFIEEQVAQTKQALEVSERKLVEYAESQGLTTTADNASLISVNIANVNKQLADAGEEKLKTEALVIQIEQAGPASLPQVYESESIQTTRGKIADLNAEYQQKLGTLKPGFPAMKKLRAQIQSLQRNVNSEISAIAKGVKIQHQQQIAKEAILKKQLVELEAEQAGFQKKNIRYTILKREADSNRTQYDSLIKKLSELGVGADLQSSKASMVEEAEVPWAPFSPNLTRNVVFSLALMAGLAAAFVYVLELLNNTFSLPDQIESSLNLSVLGILPKVESENLRDDLNDIRSSLSEAHRTLRTSLQFANADREMKTILVTSAEPSEGKTTVASRLAIDFAMLGRRVLIIDSDLRKPRLHREYGIENGVGLSNLLTNMVEREEVASLFKPLETPNLYCMTAGVIPPNPADLLASSRTSFVLEQFKKQFDVIILDAPPVMGLADAAILSRLADATLMVISCKQVPRNSVKSAVARLKATGGHIVGAAFTKFEVNSLDYNYSYRYMKDSYSYGGEQPALTGGTTNMDSVLGDGKKTGFMGNLLGYFSRGSG